MDELPAGVSTENPGVLHGAELPLVFDTLDSLGLTLEEGGEAFKEDLHGRWLGFIQKGNPNGGANQHGAEWPLYTPEGCEMLRLPQHPSPLPCPAQRIARFCVKCCGGS